MNAIEQLKHAEEVDIIRRDFQKNWDEHVRPMMLRMTFTREQEMLIELACWRCFLNGRLKR